jgi:hypothetical protein
MSWVMNFVHSIYVSLLGLMGNKTYSLVKYGNQFIWIMHTWYIADIQCITQHSSKRKFLLLTMKGTGIFSLHAQLILEIFQEIIILRNYQKFLIYKKKELFSLYTNK